MSKSVKEYTIVIALAVGFLGLMRWNAVQQNTSLVDGSANEHIVENEIHFKNLRQLTFSGENAEAYFSSDSQLVMGLQPVDIFNIQIIIKLFMLQPIMIIKHVRLPQILAGDMYGNCTKVMIFFGVMLMAHP